MIIDSHVHIGRFTEEKEMKEITVLESMKKYNIDYSLISCLECCCYDIDGKYIEKDKRLTQYECNNKALAFGRSNPDKIGVVMMAEPMENECDEDFIKQIENNKNLVYGIKFHPYHTKVRMDDERTAPYLRAALKYNLPVIVHTAADETSDVKYLYEVAKEYPQVNFVAAHMGLGTDNLEAIEYIKRLPNLYGDTTWVSPTSALKVIKECGNHKIMFGSDNPIDGLDTYSNPDFYKFYFTQFKQLVKKEDYARLMYKNAVNLFKLPCDIQ